jgi:hypothetical protein
MTREEEPLIDYLEGKAVECLALSNDALSVAERAAALFDSLMDAAARIAEEMEAVA